MVGHRTCDQEVASSIHSLVKKGSTYSITKRTVPELIPILGSQPAGDVSHKPGDRLPLLFARPAVTPATLNLTTRLPSHPNLVPLHNDSGHVVHTHVSPLWSSIIWYQRKWDVNRHTTRCTSHVSMVLQCKLESGWGLQKRRSAPTYGPMWLGKDFTFLRTYWPFTTKKNEAYICTLPWSLWN